MQGNMFCPLRAWQRFSTRAARRRAGRRKANARDGDGNLAARRQTRLPVEVQQVVDVRRAGVRSRLRAREGELSVVHGAARRVQQRGHKRQLVHRVRGRVVARDALVGVAARGGAAEAGAPARRLEHAAERGGVRRQPGRVHDEVEVVAVRRQDARVVAEHGGERSSGAARVRGHGAGPALYRRQRLRHRRVRLVRRRPLLVGDRTRRVGARRALRRGVQASGGT